MEEVVLTPHAEQLPVESQAIANSYGDTKVRVGHVVLAFLRDTQLSVAKGVLIGAGFDPEEQLQNAPFGEESQLGGVVNLVELANAAIREGRSLGQFHAAPGHWHAPQKLIQML